MMNAIFRIEELVGGRITIDGLDIAAVPLSKLRSSLGIIPVRMYECIALVVRLSLITKSFFYIARFGDV